MKYYSLKTLAVIPAGLLVAAPMFAANYTSVIDENGSGTWNDSDWELNGSGPTTTPTAGNTYEYVGKGVGLGGDLGNSILRSPKLASPGSDFLGFSLQMDANTGIRLKSVGAGSIGSGDSTFSFGTGGLILNGGYLGNGDDFSATITSPVNVLANSAIYAGQSATEANTASGTRNGFRNYIFNGSLSGSANLTLGNAIMGSAVTAAHGGPVSTANFAFKGSGADYSGNITVTSGWLQAGSANAFGSANITLAGGAATTGINGPAEFDATVSFFDIGTLTIQDPNNTLLLDNDITIGSLIIDGDTIANGTYTAAQINALTGDSNAIDNGTGDTITIGITPEPSAMALGVLGSLGVIIGKFRRRK